MKTAFHTMIVTTLVFVLVDSLGAQMIDFEQVPGIGVPQEGQTIENQYSAAPFNITFSLLDQNFNTSGAPVVAVVGGSDYFAFQGPARPEPACKVTTSTQVDMPAANQGVGCRFITDDGVVAGPPDKLFVSYSASVAQASGDLLDIDALEAWRIRAYDQPSVTSSTSNMHIGELVLCSANFAAANVGANCSPAQSIGNGLATRWSFSLPQATIRGILVEYIGGGTNVGLAFDNFSPSSLGSACDSVCCLGACCLGDQCFQTTTEFCEMRGGRFQGERTKCGLRHCLLENLCFPSSVQGCEEAGGNVLPLGEPCPIDISL